MLSIGDAVTLNDGYPIMLVKAVNDIESFATCIWVSGDGDEIRSLDFKINDLIKVEAKENRFNAI